MTATVKLTADQASDLIFDALVGAGTVARNARYFADAILDTELSGLEGHGFYWLQYYCEHVETGKVDGKATPVVKRLTNVSFRVDAKNGFAHPAIEKGFASGDYTKLAAGREGLEAWRGGIVWVADELRDLSQQLNLDPRGGTAS